MLRIEIYFESGIIVITFDQEGRSEQVYEV